MADSRGFPRLPAAPLLAVLALLAWAPAAGAQSCEAPPGTAGIDQYCESIPGPGGERGRGDPAEGGQPVSPSTRRALERRGEAGQAILGLGGTERGARKRTRLGESAGPSPSAGESPSDDPFSAIGSALGTGAGTGGAFLWVLTLVALLCGGFAWVRYRRGSGPDEAAE